MLRDSLQGNYLNWRRMSRWIKEVEINCGLLVRTTLGTLLKISRNSIFPSGIISSTILSTPSASVVNRSFALKRYVISILSTRRISEFIKFLDPHKFPKFRFLAGETRDLRVPI